jgi:hypothetical protein
MKNCKNCKTYRDELYREQKRTTVLSDALIQIYGIAKDKMWYPSTFEERGEDGYKSQAKFVEADLAAIKHEGYDK